MDPAFAVAVCRYDSRQRADEAHRAGEPGLHVGHVLHPLGVAYYGINDRAAGRRTIELDLMTTPQRDDLPDDEDVTAADRLIIESPTPHRPDRAARAQPRAGPDADGARVGRGREVPHAVKAAPVWRVFRLDAYCLGIFASAITLVNLAISCR